MHKFLSNNINPTTLFNSKNFYLKLWQINCIRIWLIDNFYNSDFDYRSFNGIIVNKHIFMDMVDKAKLNFNKM